MGVQEIACVVSRFACILKCVCVCVYISVRIILTIPLAGFMPTCPLNSRKRKEMAMVAPAEETRKPNMVRKFTKKEKKGESELQKFP